MRTAKTHDAQADPSLHWTHTHFVGFVMRQLIFVGFLTLSAHYYSLYGMSYQSVQSLNKHQLKFHYVHEAKFNLKIKIMYNSWV